MRSRALLYGAVAFAAASVPLAAGAAVTFPFYGPIVPEAVSVCPASWAMLMDVVNRIIVFGITVLVTIVGPLLVAYAGFLYVLNPVNPSGKAKASAILKDFVIGLVVALASWLIVGAVFAALTPNGRPFGQNWASIITSGGLDPCLIQAGSLNTLNQTDFKVTGVSGDGMAVSVQGKTLPLCSDANTACSPAALQAAGFTPTQANVMSCIAITESSGNAVPAPPCNGNACGLFQIMLSLNPLKGSACTKFPVTDCTGPSACNVVAGRAKNASSPQCVSCIQNEKQAALDAQCNAQSAHALYAQAGYSPWTCANCNSKAASCVSQYGGT